MPDAMREFAKTLFQVYPDFIPTQALYLDLEGRQNGSEDVLSLYWPVLPGSWRFSWVKRSDSTEINLEETAAHLRSVGAKTRGGQSCIQQGDPRRMHDLA